MNLSHAIGIVRDALQQAPTSPLPNNSKHRVFSNSGEESSGLNIIYEIANRSVDRLDIIARTAKRLAELRRDQGRKAAKSSVKELQNEIFREDYQALIDKALVAKDISSIHRTTYSLAGGSFNVPYESLDIKLKGDGETELVINIKRWLAHEKISTSPWKLEISLNTSKFPETARKIPNKSQYKYQPEAKVLDELYSAAIDKLAGKNTYTQR